MASFVDGPEASTPLVADTAAPNSNLTPPNPFAYNAVANTSQLLPAPASPALEAFAGTDNTSLSETFPSPIEPDIGLAAPSFAAFKPSSEDLPVDQGAPFFQPWGDSDSVTGSQGDRSFDATYFDWDTDALLEFQTSHPSLPLTLADLPPSAAAIDSPTITPELHQPVEYSATAIAKDPSSAEFAATYRHVFDPPMRVEAEDMTTNQYRSEATSMASGGQILSLSGKASNEVGTASLTFTGKSGYYDIALQYFDENDGEATLEVHHEKTLLDRWTLDQQLGTGHKSDRNYLSRTVGSSVFLKTGDTLEIKGSEQAGEHARIDYLEFTATSPTSVDSDTDSGSDSGNGSAPGTDTLVSPAPSPAKPPLKPKPEPTPEPISQSPLPKQPSGQAIRLEAEAMKRWRYDIEQSSAASGGRLVTLGGDGQLETGTATANFTGKSGTYDVVVGYFDENDGNAQLSLSHQNKVLDRWNLDQQLGTDAISTKNRVERTVAKNLTVTTGDVFQLKGTETADEYARVDYIDFIPSATATPTPPTSKPPSTPPVLPPSPGQSDKPDPPDDVDPTPPQIKDPNPPKVPRPPKPPLPEPPKPKPIGPGKLLFEDDFESGISKDWRAQETAKKSYSLNVVDAPGGRSGKAARFELHKDDPWVADSKRSELVRESDPAGSERWYGFSLYLPEDWKSDPAGEVVTQWHSKPDKHLGENFGLGGPPLALIVDGDEIYVQSRWDPSPVTSKQSKTRQESKLWRGSYEKGEWMDWVVQVDWSHQSDGVLRMWKDGDLVVDRKGANTYNDQVGPYFKTGIYKYSWKRSPEKSNTDKRVLYVDNVRIADGSANFATVDPSE
ncbi:MAG: heparin lyase I family protein [Synechococcales bacterium]|nr:heparin lyase I family protein [Synechococcales bacterium]